MTSFVLYEVICVALFYTCFCRLVRTNGMTFFSVKLAFVIMATICVTSAALPFYINFVPNWTHLPLPLAMLLVQAITARHWKDEVPPHFQQCACE